MSSLMSYKRSAVAPKAEEYSNLVGFFPAKKAERAHKTHCFSFPASGFVLLILHNNLFGKFANKLH